MAAQEFERVRAEFAVTDRVRGLMLGLALGDAVGGGQVSQAGVVPCGVGTQLAAATAEGLIRAKVRYAHKGIVSFPGVVWRAYRRWAAAQGLVPPGHGEPSGWLCSADFMTHRRGSAPATVTALQAGKAGTPDEPVGTSAGAHALVRALPLAAVVAGADDPAVAAHVAAQTAALTHGDPRAWASAGAGAVMAAALIAQAREGQGKADVAAAHAVMTAWALAEHPEATGPVTQAHLAVQDTPASPRGLARACRGRTADQVLAGAVYCLLSYPEPGQVMDALTLAGTAGDGRATAAVTGALAGAAHGAAALPVPLVSRLEAGWGMEVLARDLVTEMVHSPAGTEYSPAPDPTWWRRYPGH